MAAIFVVLVLVGAVIWGWYRWFVKPGGLRGPAVPPPPPPPPAVDDPWFARLLELEAGMNGAPQVGSADEMLLLPAFRAIVAHLARPEVTNDALERFVTGDKALPAWGALVALSRRPHDADLSARALHWLNQFHPWSRELTLRLLEAWHPDDPKLAGRVLARLDRGWAADSRTVMVLDRFLRRRAAVAPLAFHGALAGRDADALEPLFAILGEAEPALVQPLLAEAQLARAEAGADSGGGPAGPPAADASSAGRRHEPGAFASPVLYPRATMATARERALRALAASPRRSVLVAGEPGVGKTTLARALAAEMSAQGWRVFETGALELNAGMSYVGQLEGRIQALLQEVRREPKTLWLVRDFHQLLWTGRSSQNLTGALDLLQPALESGELVVIGESRALAVDVLLGERPELARLMEVVRLEPPREEELPGIARAWDAAQPAGAGTPAAVLDEAVALARHHLGALGMPAGLVRVLERAREVGGEGEPGGAIGPDRLLRALAELTGLPADLLDERQALDTSALQKHFASRVIGQEHAVSGVVERIALMKAGIASPSRPYGVLLFAGPTGTGKTELVKALASWLFGSEDRLVRVDMSELQDAGAMDRMLAPGGLAAGGSLAARVRRQPFAVVLLDEFEKAHPRVWDLFLQVFDDGRLTDARGDTVDFRNTFIVLTSNLGARLQAHERLGFVAGKGFNPREVERVVAQAFRPELLNRIDRVVVFRPLTREVMRDILLKQIREAFQRRGLRNRDWAVEIEESALAFLLERGFTPDLGARPLQRAIEQHLLAPLARAIVERRAPEGDQFLFVRSDGERLAVEFVDPDAPQAAPAPAAMRHDPGARGDLRAIAWDARGTEDEVALMRAALEALEAEVASGPWPERKSAWLAESAEPGFWQRADRFEVLGRVEYMDRVEAGVRSARSLLARLGRDAGSRPQSPRPLVRRLAQQLLLLRQAAQEAFAQGPGDAFVSLEPGPDSGASSEARAWRDRLAGMYDAWARARGMRIQELDPEDVPAPHARGARWFAISGFAALATLRGEEGLHLHESGGIASGSRRTSARVRVVAQPSRPAKDRSELAHQAAEAFAAIDGAPAVVRRYREEPSPLVRDLAAGWRTGRADRVLEGDFDVVPVGDAEVPEA